MKKILSCFGFLCVLGIASYVFFQASNLWGESVTSKEIAKEIQKIKDAGEPTSIEELVPLDIPDSENGALIYSQAFNLLKELRGKYKDEWRYFPYEGEVKWNEAPESEKEKVRNLLLRDPDFVRFYQLLEKASGMKCQFLKRTDYKGAETLMPHLASLRSCARVLAARADIQAEKGEVDNALYDCLTCLKISNSLSLGSNLIMGLVGIATDSIALARMEEIMRNGDVKPETYQVLMKEVASKRNDKIMYRGLLGERVICGMAEFSGIKKQIEKKNIEPLVGLFGPEEKDRNKIAESIQKDPAFFLEENELAYFKTMVKWIALSKKPYFEAREEIPGLEKEISGLPDEKAALVKFLIQTLSQVPIHEARVDAQLGNAEIALACHLYKAKHKDYPASLKELSPEFLLELPLDPFTGTDYIYRMKDKGFIVYSLGDNRKDDGGIPQFSEQGKKGDFDIVWEDSGAGTILQSQNQSLPEEISQYYQKWNFVASFSTSSEQYALLGYDGVKTLPSEGVETERFLKIFQLISELQVYELPDIDPGISPLKGQTPETIRDGIFEIYMTNKTDGKVLVTLFYYPFRPKAKITLISQYEEHNIDKIPSFDENPELFRPTASFPEQRVHTWKSINGKWMKEKAEYLLID